MQETQKSNNLTDFPVWDLMMSRKYLFDGEKKNMTRAQESSNIEYGWNHTFRDAS